MELENLKTALDKRVRSVPPQGDLLAAGARSVSVLARIEKSIRWEIFIAAAFLVFCLLQIFLSEATTIRIFLSMLMAYTTMFLVQLRRLLHQSQQATNSARPIKACVNDTISVVKSFMKLYQRLTSWFVPLVFVAAMSAACIAAFSRTGSFSGFPFFTVLASLPLIAGWIWLMRRFAKWWLNRLYGQYLDMLLLQLAELTNED